MNIPESYKYTKDHEYINVTDGTGTIGVTDYAQSELGDIIYLDVTASVGADVKKGDSLGSIEAVKTVSDVFSPVSGKLVEINTTINENPSLINEDPNGKGWLVKIELSNKSELDELLDAAAYKTLIGE
jgi:glycine cleavage system H protein